MESTIREIEARATGVETGHAVRVQRLHHALAHAAHELLVASRRCCLLTPPNWPERPIVASVREWIIQEALSDMRAVERQYPRLGLRDALRQTGIELG